MSSYGQSQMTEHEKFTYCRLEKALEKQMRKKVDILKSLYLSDKIDELKLSESKFRKQKGKILKILTFIGNTEIFPMALVQVKRVNKTVASASVNVISKIRQIIYSLFGDK